MEDLARFWARTASRPRTNGGNLRKSHQTQPYSLDRIGTQLGVGKGGEIQEEYNIHKHRNFPTHNAPSVKTFFFFHPNLVQGNFFSSPNTRSNLEREKFLNSSSSKTRSDGDSGGNFKIRTLRIDTLKVIF